MAKRVFYIKAEWDADAGVWTATQSDVPGLVAEAATPQELIDLIGGLVPELLTLNGFAGVADDVSYSILFDRMKPAHAVA